MFKTFIRLAFGGIMMFPSGVAIAHHPMGGNTPSTIWEGLLSGVGHPIIGFDHLAFIVAVGLAASFFSRRYLLPLAFIFTTVIGCLLQFNGVALPSVELIIAGSVVVLGSLIVLGKPFSETTYGGIFTVAGLFHGWAYGQAIIGAESTPLLAYLLSFGLTQYVLAVSTIWLVRNVYKATKPSALHPRIIGALATGIGIAIFLENIESLIFF